MKHVQVAGGFLTWECEFYKTEWHVLVTEKNTELYKYKVLILDSLFYIYKNNF